MPLRFFRASEFLTYNQFISLRSYVNQLNFSLYFHNTKNLMIIRRENMHLYTYKEKKLVEEYRYKHLLTIYRLYAKPFLKGFLKHLNKYSFVSRAEFYDFFPSSFSETEIAELVLIEGEKIYLTADGIFVGYTSSMSHLYECEQILIEGLHAIYRIDKHGGEILESRIEHFFGKGGYYSFLKSLKYKEIMTALRVKIGQRMKHFVYFMEFDKENSMAK